MPDEAQPLDRRAARAAGSTGRGEPAPETPPRSRQRARPVEHAAVRARRQAAEPLAAPSRPPERPAAHPARGRPPPASPPAPAAPPTASAPAWPGSASSAPTRTTRSWSRCCGSCAATTPRSRPPRCARSSSAYQVAERWHRGQKRKSGDPYITHPLAVTTILAELGMDPATLMAGLLHDTVEDTEYGLDTAAPRLRRPGRPARRRRHQAGQGQVRRGRAGRDRAQDGRRHGQGPARPGHQARRPAAQHAHHALPQAREAGEEGPRDAGDLRAARPPPGHEHHQVGAGGPRLRDPLPQDVRRDRPAGRRAGPQARRVPRHSDRRGPVRPARRPDQGRPSPAARSTTTASTRR